ncbi:DUF3265 domain-containing protein [Vibrio parahaemolyticus]|nr:DUF3265 domain-containing protein [Vibrio parahaemolyticus]
MIKVVCSGFGIACLTP